MRIASITLYCNESFRLNQWINYVAAYEDELYLQVIVNNGSQSDTDVLRKAFPKAVILYSSSSNMIASYNLALDYILNNTDADAILQITNDLKVEKGGLTLLYKILYEHEDCGMISPILLQKDSEIVENYGAEIDLSNMSFNHVDRDRRYSEISPKIVYRTGLPGGCFLAKRVVYETIGGQDEKINMYSDEVDMGIKCATYGFKLISTKEVKSWHQHVFLPGRTQRTRMASFLMARNPIYIARKHFRQRVVLNTFMNRFKLAILELLSCIHHLKGKEAFMCSLWSLKGCLSGLFMKL